LGGEAIRKKVTTYHLRPVDFERRRKDPAAWQSVAISLYFAASLLWQRLSPSLKAYEEGQPLTSAQEMDLRLRGPFAMLAGLSIENMLKGLIVQHGFEYAKTHNLVDLSKRANIKWKQASGANALLVRLTTFVEWAGRYPVALSEKKSLELRILTKSDYPRIAQISSLLHDVHLGKIHVKDVASKFT
jgi:hypothetical protein